MRSEGTPLCALFSYPHWALKKCSKYNFFAHRNVILLLAIAQDDYDFIKYKTQSSFILY